MKAAVINNDKIKIEEIEAPSIEKYGNGAVVKILGSGLCGSDIIKYLHKKNGRHHICILDMLFPLCMFR